jgi:hypothetical protein
MAIAGTATVISTAFGCVVSWNRIQAYRSQTALNRTMRDEVLQRMQHVEGATSSSLIRASSGLDAPVAPSAAPILPIASQVAASDVAVPSVLSASSSPPSASVAPAALATGVAQRRWFPYPWLFVLATSGLVAVIICFAYVGPDIGQAVADLFAIPLMIVGITKAVKLRRWGWVISIILLGTYSLLVFGLRGPTTVRVKKQAAAAVVA